MDVDKYQTLIGIGMLDICWMLCLLTPKVTNDGRSKITFCGTLSVTISELIFCDDKLVVTNNCSKVLLNE